MARLFDDAQSEYLGRSDAILTSTPLALVTWFNTNDVVTENQVPIGIFDASKDTEWFLLNLAVTQANDPLRAHTGGGASNVYASVDGIQVNTWHHGAGIFATATDRRVFLDGNKGVNNSDSTPSGLDRMAIGCIHRLNPGLYFSGMVAETAIYNLSDYPGATASDKADYFEANVLPKLVANESPSNYPLGLIAYWPLRDDDEDDADDFDLTPYNTPSWGATHPDVIYHLAGSLGAQSTLTANIKTIEKLAGLIEAQSALTGAIDSILVYNLTGLIAGQSSASGNINTIEKLSGLVAAQTGLTGNIKAIEQLSGLIAAQSTVVGKLRDLSSLSGTIDATTTATGLLNAVEKLSGDIAAQSSLTGNIQWCYAEIPPAMHANLIDPYSGGAWLWLVEIWIPGYGIIRLARNTEDIVYGGLTYSADNFDIGLDPLTADGSVPRTLLKITQDANYTLEDILNATKGGYGGRIRIIRTHENYLTTPVIALERLVDILTSESDTEHIIIPCGIPNPLLKKIPLYRGSSKICPWASPGLFKGVDCQYVGGDGTCTGKYEDCYTKGNAVHWGAELGLDPSVTKV